MIQKPAYDQSVNVELVIREYLCYIQLVGQSTVISSLVADIISESVVGILFLLQYEP